MPNIDTSPAMPPWRILCVACALLPVGAAYSQTIPEEKPGLVLRQSVRRVSVDVVVTDAQGHPVAGLASGSFHLGEDGKPQTIRHFDAHSPALDRSAKPALPLRPDLPLHTYINLPTAAAAGAITVILYDVLNTPLSAQPYAHQQVLKFLRSQTAPGQTAIFILSDRLHLLRGFTGSQAELLAAFHQGAGPQSSALLTSDQPAPPSSASAQPDANPTGQPSSPDPGSAPTLLSLMGRMESLYTSALLDRRVETTLDAMQQIARFLSVVPGRKNLIWLSGSFPANIEPDPDASFDSNNQMRNYGPDLKRTSDLLNLSHVAVYPVDIRGLMTDPMFDASNHPDFAPGKGAPGTSGLPANAKAAQDFSRSLAAEHGTMENISQQTGGRAFYNTNGLSQALETAFADGSTYYSLEYEPANPAYDGTLRRIQVKLDGSGYHLAYRRSYFADDLSGASHSANSASPDPDLLPGMANPAPQLNSLADAMQLGAPESRDLIFAAHIDPVGAPELATPAQMEKLAPYEDLARRANGERAVRDQAGKPRPPVLLQQYSVQFAVLARQLDLANTLENGVYRPDLSFVILSFNADGDALYGIKTSIQDVILPARLAEVEAEGYRLAQSLLVPVTASALRLAVRDGRTNRTGSMEVRLPLPPTPAAPKIPDP